MDHYEGVVVTIRGGPLASTIVTLPIIPQRGRPRSRAAGAAASSHIVPASPTRRLDWISETGFPLFGPSDICAPPLAPMLLEQHRTGPARGQRNRQPFPPAGRRQDVGRLDRAAAQI